MKKEIILIFFLGFLLLLLNYNYFDSNIEKIFENSETGIVQKVIDGDTIKVNNYSIRLLGINSPEKGEVLYEESREFLKNKILGKEVKIIFDQEKYDRYHRKLGFIFLGKENINLESVKLGLSNPYFPKGKRKYYSLFQNAWEICLKANKNLCKNSNESCIILRNWDIENQVVELQNICGNTINLENWSIKDEGRKKFIFKNKLLKQFETINITSKDFKKDYVWTKSGDSIFIRDHKNNLVIWKNY